MDRKTIDQTASELQLHRVLYVIKFLRAMVLHVILVVLAALLYFLTGIDNAYPVGTAFFQAFRAQSIDYSLQGGSAGSASFAIGLAFVAFAVLALLVWMYRSIKRCGGGRSCSSGIDPDRGAFEHLPIFAELAIRLSAFESSVCRFGHVERDNDRGDCPAQCDSRTVEGRATAGEVQFGGNAGSEAHAEFLGLRE